MLVLPFVASHPFLRSPTLHLYLYFYVAMYFIIMFCYKPSNIPVFMIPVRILIVTWELKARQGVAIINFSAVYCIYLLTFGPPRVSLLCILPLYVTGEGQYITGYV